MRKILFSLFCLVCSAAIATHNRSGYISYTCNSNGQYTFYIHTWTNASSTASDRCDFWLWIDNGLDSAHCTRINGSNPCPNGPIGLDGVVILPPQGGASGIRENVYQSDSVFTLSPGQHVFTLIDPNRSAGIINLGGTSSQNYAFAISDTLLLSTSFPGQMTNNSPVVSFAPINAVIAGQPYSYNPGMVDPDNDSLDYSLWAPYDSDPTNQPAGTMPIAAWYKPAGLIINSSTGEMHVSVAPLSQGEYVVTMRVREFRRNPYTGNCNTWYVIGETFYDIEFTVTAGSQALALSFNVPQQVCIQQGTTFNMQAVATGTTTAPPMMMEAAGLPITGLNIGTNALFSNIPSNGPVYGYLTWNASCYAVSNLSYPVYFRVMDNNYPPHANFATVFVKVVSAPPQNVTATNNGNSVTVAWNQMLNCDSDLVDYYIYRKDSCDNFSPAICQTGAPAGYIHVGTVPASVSTYTDTGVAPGPHSYLVVAHFVDCSESAAAAAPCVTSAVDEERFDDILNLFPNPTTGDLQIIISSQEDARVAITNTIGQIVFLETIHGEKHSDLSALSKGIYFVNVKMNGRSVNRKVVKE